MADIKLYGKIHNQDGNLLISPLEVAGVNEDGSIPEGAATETNNIISYINSKTGTITTDVSGIKTDISGIKTNINGIKTDISGIKTNITTTKKEVKEYTDAQISTALSSVYKVKGTYLVSAIKNNAWKEGDVVDVIDSTGFMIDGKKYPPHTNIVFLQNVNSPKYDTVKGFDGTLVDGLGGMIDASQIESNADKKYIKEIKYDPTVSPIDLTTGSSKLLGKLSYTIGNTTKSIDITAPISPIPKNTFEASYGIKISEDTDTHNFKFEFNSPRVYPYNPKTTYTYLMYNTLTNSFNLCDISDCLIIQNNESYGLTEIGINISNLSSSLQLNSKADVSTVNGVSGRVTTLEGTIKNKADNATVTSLESRVSALESLLSLG